jgi:hypothetical protein
MWVGRIARQLGWGRNPLRRACDRWEIGLTLVLVLAMMVLGPWVGRQAAELAYRNVVQSNAWEREHRSQIDAVLQENVSVAPADNAEPDAPSAGTAMARWIAPDGTVRTGAIDVGAARQAGDTVPIWIDDHGQLALPPARRNPGTDAGVAAALSICAVAVCLAGVRRMVGWQLERRRLRVWEAQWAVVEPVWSRR